ncbi:PAS domain-containing sensor histidine kinase [Methanolobus bombayensis]|uniref:sensor histidine kinase n=1 Tax=Methanolobus bombayensis TaxID=38023 RepID=UPI001AE77BB2|nr:PAS domain-containing sensor histidine kinase [Methanolobus bombayensis]MBP1908109.1 PAS domain S-box-containing protein [Methanolobus bombayensis]
MVINKNTHDFENDNSAHSTDIGESLSLPVSEISFSDIAHSQTFYDLLDQLVLIVDENDSIIMANKKAQDYLGFDHSTESGKFTEKYVPEDEKEYATSFLSSFFQENKDELALSFSTEFLIKGSDDTITTFLVNVSLLKDADSPEKALLLSFIDIQEKNDVQNEMLKDIEKLFIHLDSIPYALVFSDHTGKITFWNRNATRLFGYKEDEIVGQNITRIMPKRYRKAHEGWEELISIGKSPVVGKIIEVAGLRKDDTEFPIELAITTTRYKGDIFHGAIINDISQRKMKERLTSIAKNKYRMMFEKSPLGIFHFDENGTITQCNEILVRILGVPEEQVISKIIGFNIIDSFSEDNEIKKAIKQVLAGIPARYEDDFYSPFSDKVIPIKAEFSPVVSDEGKFMGGVCVVEDFTERKAAEEALNKYAEDLARANEELTSLDRMKDEFISNLRHELKTPLIPIKGYSELMYEGSLGELNQKQKDAVEKMMLSSERLKRLIDSLLYVSITEGGNVEYTFVPLRICEVIDSALHDRSPEISSKAHTVEKSIPCDIPLIDGDLDYLEEVFVNLIDNSIKFMNDGGKIKISAVLQENTKIHIKISDEGIGISEENLPHIFNRFYQVDGSSTRKYGGNGLGLYICKKIIEAHNGEIWAESDGSKGATIHILLPVK